MNPYRPYYDAESFNSPVSAVHNIEYLEELDHTWLRAVGLSAAKFYAKSLISQPFEVSKFLLQTQDFNSPYGRSTEEYPDSSDEEVDYFIDSSGMRALPQKSNSSKKKGSDLHNLSLQLVPATERQVVQLKPKIFDIMNQLVENDGAVGLWRATNTSCLYEAGTMLIEAWICGFSSSLLNIPDPQFVDILQVADPSLFLVVAGVARALSYIIMSPISLIRARLIITKFTTLPRSLRASLTHISSFRVSPFVWLPTIFSQVGQRLIQLAAPWILFKKAGVDEFRSPFAYSVFNLVLELCTLVFKLPLDTFANRALANSVDVPADALIIQPVPYHGMFKGLWDVAVGKEPVRSLYGGWRLEAVGVLSNWGYNTLEQTRPAREKF